MRIAYITPYQGPTLVSRRPIVGNRSVSNKIKIELIARLLQESGHEVEIISHGEVIERRLTFYPGFSESERFHAEIPIYYVSSLPVKRVNGLWAGMRAVQFLKKRHRERPYDLVIIFNMKPPQIRCANYAMRRLRLPVILQYEDDVFVDVLGETQRGLVSRYHRAAYTRILKSVSGCMAVSPHLLSQVSPDLPSLLLRGVVGDDVSTSGTQMRGSKKNWVMFAGTHVEWNGIRELVEAWKIAGLSGWELHITGYGSLTEELRKETERDSSIIFHGLVSREELVGLLCSAKICVNPQAASQTPGNVFAFKIIEYLAAGAHVITTPMGSLEPDLEAGVTYMSNNRPATIAATLRQAIQSRAYERTATHAAARIYGSEAVSRLLDSLLNEVVAPLKVERCCMVSAA
jgi:glycosyltransferase involved in cell wall biosynthesis